MSLKAKLEAVIYAAEEPVTLAQLALLFTEEALEWKAEQEAASSPGRRRLGSPTENPSLPPTPNSISSSPNSLPRLRLRRNRPSPSARRLKTQLPRERTPKSTFPWKAALSSTPIPTAVGEAAAEAALKREARLRDREVRAILRQLLDELIADYASDGRGIEIREIAGGYRMATKPEYHDAVRTFVKSLKPALKLSLPALETLAVIAYKQPVTAPEVNEIRGVDSSGVFGSLLARKLIATAGRKPVIGRPILYKTTKEFLFRFGLKDVTELPSMEEFEKMAAIELEEPELAESEHAGQRDAVPEFREDLSLEVDRADAEEHEDEASAEATT